MSVWAKTWAYEQHPKRVDDEGNVTEKKHPAAKAVLVALAEFPGPGQRDCWPSQETLAEMTDFTSRQVRACLADLESQGLIARHQRRRQDGSRRSDRITLLGPVKRFGPTKTPQDADEQPEESSGSQPEESSNQPEESSGHEPSVSTNRNVPPTEAANDKSNAADRNEKAEEIWPGDHAPVREKQSYFIAYLHRRLEERDLLDKPITPSYKKQLAGEIAAHLNKGYGRGRILAGLDYVVFRWRIERVGLTVGIDRAEGQDNVRRLRPRDTSQEPRRPQKRVIQ